MKIEQKTNESPDVRYWRIRMKNRDENLAKSAWMRNEVGIWYGRFSADDWYKSQLKNPNKQFRYLAKLRQPKGRGKFRRTDFNTAKRFTSIKEDDWVVVFFDDSLHLARVRGGLKSSPKHSMNINGEIFKYRKIVDKKSFQLSRLPDPYRLISAMGRANVHEFSQTRTLIKFLAENKNEKSAIRAISSRPIMEWLDLLGPAQWESFCLGYLIITEGFVPTGLGTGRTLPTLDIVGRNKRGVRVMAQCKKDSNPLRIPADFINACEDMKKKALVYFFAYGGVIGNSKNPKWIKVVSRGKMQRWVKTTAGRKYAAMWYKDG